VALPGIFGNLAEFLIQAWGGAERIRDADIRRLRSKGRTHVRIVTSQVPPRVGSGRRGRGGGRSCHARRRQRIERLE
jgi:hypothetical protein